MPRQRIIAMVLAVFLLFMGLYSLGQRVEQRYISLMFCGSFLGLCYAIFGRMPQFARRWAHLNDDNDPSNLSAKLYLPILLAVVLFAGGVAWWSLSK